jgi:mono/diheme cytochrome c family protein
MIGLFIVLTGLAHSAEGDLGKRLYRSNCLACHGPAADGQGPAAAALRPPPTDFTSTAYWAQTSNGQVKAAIKTGSPGTSMMGFGRFTDAELDALVSFLRSKASSE